MFVRTSNPVQEEPPAATRRPGPAAPGRVARRGELLYKSKASSPWAAKIHPFGGGRIPPAGSRNARWTGIHPGPVRKFNTPTSMTTLRSKLGSEIPHLRRYARCLAGSRHEADDLVQACLERALARESLWDPDRGLRSWLFRILHNLHVSSVRGKKREVRVDGVPEETNPVAPGQESARDLEVVRDAMNRLPSDHREVLLLIAVEGFSYQEAATILEVPLGTVRSRLARAREGLRGLLEPDDTRIKFQGD